MDSRTRSRQRGQKSSSSSRDVRRRVLPAVQFFVGLLVAGLGGGCGRARRPCGKRVGRVLQRQDRLRRQHVRRGRRRGRPAPHVVGPDAADERRDIAAERRRWRRWLDHQAAVRHDPPERAAGARGRARDPRGTGRARWAARLHRLRADAPRCSRRGVRHREQSGGRLPRRRADAVAQHDLRAQLRLGFRARAAVLRLHAGYVGAALPLAYAR